LAFPWQSPGKQKNGFPREPPIFSLRRTLVRSVGPPSSKQGETQMTHYTLTVPVKYDDNGTEKTTYRRVGAVFENTKRDTGETFLTLKLDFPVGVTELVAFQPSAKGDVTE
jgi:hypothetical protein